MVKVTYKKKFLKLTHIWFCDNDNPVDADDGDILYYHGLKEIPDFINKKFM